MRIARYWALLEMVLFPRHTGVTVFGFFLSMRVIDIN